MNKPSMPQPRPYSALSFLYTTPSLLLLLPTLAACYQPSGRIAYPESVDIPADCEVVMHMVHGEDLKIPGTKFDRQKSPLHNIPGSIYVVSEPICVKREGKEPEIQSTIRLNLVGGAYNHFRMCEEDSDSPDTAIKGAKESCTWNHYFRHAYPSSFVFYTVNGNTLSEHLRFIRVFRNGELVYKWSASPDLTENSMSGKYVLHVPGKQLKGTFMPNLGDIDIRLVGTTTLTDEALFDQEVLKTKDKQKELFVKALNAAIGSKAFEDAHIQSFVDKLKNEAESVQCHANAIVKWDTSTLCPNSPSGQNANEAAARAKLEDLYKEMKTRTGKDLSALQKEAERAVETRLGEIGVDGKKALEIFKKEVRAYWDGNKSGLQEGWAEYLRRVEKKGKLSELAKAIGAEEVNRIETIPPYIQDDPQKLTRFLDWIRLRSESEHLNVLLAHGDAMMNSALGMVDEAGNLVQKLRADLGKLSKSDKAQAELFQDIFHAVEGPDPFVPYAPNPLPLAGEKVLSMAYSDKTQWYALSPWYGLPIKVAGELEANINLGTFIPILDLLGLRYQFSRNRFGDFRVALGVAQAFEDVKKKNEAGEEVSVQEYRFIPELSLSVGNFRIGGGYAFGEGYKEHGWEHCRLFFGADLVKLVTGRNLEVW